MLELVSHEELHGPWGLVWQQVSSRVVGEATCLPPLEGVVQICMSSRLPLLSASGDLLFGQRLVGETKWEKGVETASCDFLRFPAISCGFLQFSATPNHLPCKSRTKSAKLCENLRQAAVSPF